MELRECTVGSYFRKKPSVRADIMFDNYENFPQIIKCFESNLRLMILSEKAGIRNARRGELGVRIQEGNWKSSPTESQALINLTLDKAMETGDFSDDFFKDMKIMQDVYDGYTEIMVMNAEYESFKAALDAIPDYDKVVVKPFLNRSKTRGELADELGITLEAISQKIKRGKKWIRDNVVVYMANYD